MKTDASKFTWHNIGEWIPDFEQLCKDATTIGLQVVSLYEGLTVDPAVAGSLGVVLTIIRDISSLLCYNRYQATDSGSIACGYKSGHGPN